jgi:hypothetical protein
MIPVALLLALLATGGVRGVSGEAGATRLASEVGQSGERAGARPE